MHCSFCESTDTKVIESRLLQEGSTVRRRRKCESCNRRFTTYEKIEIQMPMVVKKDGRRESYRREKILGGITMALQKRRISTAEVSALIDDIEKTIMALMEKEISTVKVGELVMEMLHKLDPVAYIRFASIYWNFSDFDEFIFVLKKQTKILQRRLKR